MARPKEPWKRDASKTTTERGYGAAWRKVRAQVLTRDRGLCQCSECKRLGRLKVATQVDHILAKSLGGTDDPANLQSIAADCHEFKTLIEQGKRPKPVIGKDGWPVG